MMLRDWQHIPQTASEVYSTNRYSVRILITSALS